MAFIIVEYCDIIYQSWLSFPSRLHMQMLSLYFYDIFVNSYFSFHDFFYQISVCLFLCFYECFDYFEHGHRLECVTEIELM